MSSTNRSLAPETSEQLAGDLLPLAEALGSPEAFAALTSLAESLDAPSPDSPLAVRRFLACYRERLLIPVELPAIRDAYAHAVRGEVRELIELDRRLAKQFGRSAFSEASRHVGRTQLRRLRPLRDRRLQRYLQAVESGAATGWHVVVFGLLLGLFSMPLRQGVLHYAAQTQRSLLDSASAAVPLRKREREILADEFAAPLAVALRQLLPRSARLVLA
jgi:urease accessory protein UreF